MGITNSFEGPTSEVPTNPTPEITTYPTPEISTDRNALKSQRDQKAAEFMVNLKTQFPREAKSFGLEGQPNTEFTVLKTPLDVKSSVPGGLDQEIPVTLHQHLMATRNGARILEFISYSKNGPSSYEFSEEKFQETILSEASKFRDPTRPNLGMLETVAAENAPYYNAEDGIKESFSFASGSPMSSKVLILNEFKKEAYVRLRTPCKEEVQQLIENAKKAEGTPDMKIVEEASTIQHDIENMSITF